MKATIMTVAIAAAVFCAAGYAVQPAYEGDFGNPEEPALRIVKWPWLGVKKLVSNTHEGLKAGMDQKSLCATVEEGARGAWKGSKTLAHHTANGLIYAPLPEKKPAHETKTYEAGALAFIESMTTKEDAEADGAEQAPCLDEGVKVKKEEEKYLDLKIPESDVEKAQRRYIPEKAAYRNRNFSGGGNLLKLAK